ncbi:MAG: hypothetical protein AAF674_13300 [Pseudomonadota bacterium]
MLNLLGRLFQGWYFFELLRAKETPAHVLPEQSDLPDGWTVCGDRFFAAEAAREIKEGHHLWGRALHTLACRVGDDDTLFADAETGELFVIHLTYSTAERPPWPNYHSLSDLSELKDF